MGPVWLQDGTQTEPSGFQNVCKTWPRAGPARTDSCILWDSITVRERTSFTKDLLRIVLSFLGLHASTDKESFHKGLATYRFYTRTVRGRGVPERFGSEKACVPFGSSCRHSSRHPLCIFMPLLLRQQKSFQLRLRMRCLESLFQLRLRMRCPVLVPLYFPVLHRR